MSESTGCADSSIGKRCRRLVSVSRSVALANFYDRVSIGDVCRLIVSAWLTEQVFSVVHIPRVMT
ncbi:unnamed protein product [Prunus armeniaca]